MLVILIDANAVGERARRDEVGNAIDLGDFPYAVVAVPDPHVECWFLADPESFAATFGVDPQSRAKVGCKRRLVCALDKAGEIVTGGGAEFADEIVEAMDLYRASRNEPSLKRFIDDMSAALRSLASYR